LDLSKNTLFLHSKTYYMTVDIQMQYRELVEKRCVNYGWNLNVHVKDVMVSMLMTRDKIWQGGDFTQAVIANNLGEAVRRADSDMAVHLRHMVIARDNFFLGQEW
jgi:hypothetical protein